LSDTIPRWDEKLKPERLWKKKPRGHRDKGLGKPGIVNGEEARSDHVDGAPALRFDELEGTPQTRRFGVQRPKTTLGVDLRRLERHKVRRIREQITRACGDYIGTVRDIMGGMAARRDTRNLRTPILKSGG